MPTNDPKKNFATFQPPLGDARRHAIALELDEQVFDFIESWASAQHLTIELVLELAATDLAGKLTAETFSTSTAARDLWIDRFDPDQIDRKKDRSRVARPTCGKSPSPCAFPQATSAPPASPPADPETDRRDQILGYYQALTGNRLRAIDYTALRSVFDLPDLVIQAGILHALNYATRPIGSFAYCAKSMENFLDARIDLEAVVAMLIDKLLLKRQTGQLVLPLAGEKLLIGDFQK